MLVISNGFIMDPSDLPVQPEGVDVHIRQATRAHDTSDMCHAGQ